MKYLIYPLESLCIDYLVENMSAENVLTISQFCIDCQTGSRLIYECREFVRHKTESVLKSESFAKISHKFLILLLKQKFLNATEVRLFEAVCFLLSQLNWVPRFLFHRRAYNFAIANPSVMGPRRRGSGLVAHQPTIFLLSWAPPKIKQR